MKEILADLDRWQAQGEAIALATVVAAHGSSPRPPGARFAVTRSRRMTGSVSGGCVESDVFERAMEVLDAGRPAIATYEVAGEEDLGVGLSCGGSIDVLIEAFAADDAWISARTAIEEERPAVLAICTTPGPLLGRKLALLADGRRVSSIDPALDAQVADQAGCLLLPGGTRDLTLLRRGEVVRVFVEAFPAAPRLYVVGATHAAVALCRMAKVAGFRVAVIDARGAYATPERFVEADDLVVDAPGPALDRARLDSSCFVVVLTHDPKFDLPALSSALRTPACYVGAIGSRATHAQRVARLREQGLSEEEIARIHAPIGLDLGGRSPEEMAVAILAEMIAVRHRRDARPLTGKAEPIHDRT